MTMSMHTFPTMRQRRPLMQTLPPLPYAGPRSEAVALLRSRSSPSAKPMASVAITQSLSATLRRWKKNKEIMNRRKQRVMMM